MALPKHNERPPQDVSRTPVTAAGPVPGTTSRWCLTHYLALAGTLLLLLQAWVLGAWLADGPRQITEFRVDGSLGDIAAMVAQVAIVLFSVGMCVHLVRTCRRERRLTFDAKLAIAMLLTAWLDPLPNLVQPVWFLSSEFVNVNSWGSHYPFQVNPVAGDLPWPVIFLVALYAFGGLAVPMALNALTRAIGRRWPSLSRAQLVAITYAVIFMLCPLFEAPLIGFDIWGLAGSPADGRIDIGSSMSFSWFQSPMVAFMVGTIAAVRFLRDGDGRTVVERGLDRHAPRQRAALSLLALVGLCNLVWIIGCGYQVLLGLNSGTYPDAPSYLNNHLCDVGATTGTKYGPCPGSEGYRLPLTP